MNKIKRIFCDISELIAFKHSIFALPFIFVAMITASKIEYLTMWFGFKLLILGILCAVSARNFAMAVNRYVDKDIDKDNPRCASRPSVDGRIGSFNLLLFIAINAIVFVIVAYFINQLAFILSFPILIVLGAYSFIKRFSQFAHIVLGLCLGLAPIAGAIAVGNNIPTWSLLLCFGVMFWVAGFDILYSLQDMEYDKKVGLFSIPAIYGEKTAQLLSELFHVLSILFWILYCYAANLGPIAYSGVVVSGIILFFEHRIVKKDFTKIDRAFFTLNGYLGIIFFCFIFVDLWNFKGFLWI